MNGRCDKCKWFWDSEVYLPECRRHAPRHQGESLDDSAEKIVADRRPFPAVDPDDWCGGFQRAQEAYLDVVLTRGPGPESDFVELEDEQGRSVGAPRATWVSRDDAYAVLRIYAERTGV